MNYKLIAVDIDGTLYNSQSQLTDRTISAVKSAIKKGCYFVLSTGRPYEGVSKIIKALSLENMPYILYNGAMVMIGGEKIYSLTIDPSDAKKVVDEGHKRGATMICWSNNQLYAEFYNEKIEFYKNISGVEPIIVESLADVAEQGITKFVWYDTVELTNKNHAELKEKLGATLNVHPSRVDFLEFVNKDCSKAKAMAIINEKLNLKREETVAIGDGFNDLPMLEFAGLGVAMANANQAVKDRCGLVTDSNDNDGVATFIEKYIL